MEKIDFVVTWVDGLDEEWLRSKHKHLYGSDTQLNSAARFRDWDFFQYWFRSVEQNAPWVNKIYLVTEGHLPSWININHPKLVHIKHSDYIDEEYLPTFNSNVIELNLYKISTLSEQFVLFNDDTFINQLTTAEDFFQAGLPKDIGVFSPIVSYRGSIASIVLNNVEIINDYFQFREVLKKHFKKFFRLNYGKHLIKNLCVLPWSSILGFYDHHLPVSYLKSNFEKLWSLEKQSFEETSSHKFRTRQDINHYLIRYWQLCCGEFLPRPASFGQYYNINSELESIIKDIAQGKHALICLNDGDEMPDFEHRKTQLLDAFEKRYSHKSSFEK